MCRKLSRGFTLIEVLVTLVILTFGLLGIAGLMAKSQRIGFEAFQRQQAVALASDMGERIRGNRLLAALCPTTYPACLTYTAGAPVITPLGTGVFYNDYRTGAIPDCAAMACTPDNLARYDIALWDGLLQGYSEHQTGTVNPIGGIVNARGCVQELVNTSAVCPPAPAPIGAVYSSTVRVSVVWQGNDDTAAPVSICGAGLYGTEAKRRVVTYDLMVQQLCP